MEIDVDEAEGEEHAAEAKEMFDDGKRHDALGPWGHLSEVDPNTGVSRDVTDAEVLAYGRSLGIEEDQTGSHLLNRLKSNQLISQLIRGAIQLGYQRQHFMVENHMREGQTFATPMVHSSCAVLLSKLVAKVMGYRQCTVLAPRAEPTFTKETRCDTFLEAVYYHLDIAAYATAKAEAKAKANAKAKAPPEPP
ncbi:hypothetical protein AK812_SmicGene47605, partial [Symbiodinium microadriaticum]